MSLESELDEILKKLEYWETMEPVNNMGKMSQKTALDSLNKKKLKLEKKLGILQKNQYIVEQLKLKNNMENTLRVKYSDFKTDLTFNEWAQYTRASTLWDEATNKQNLQFIEQYRNFKFAEATPPTKQTHEYAV